MGHWAKQCPLLKGKAKKSAKKSKKIWVKKDLSKEVVVAIEVPTPPKDQVHMDSNIPVVGEDVVGVDVASHQDLLVLNDLSKDVGENTYLRNHVGEDIDLSIPPKDLKTYIPLNMVADFSTPSHDPLAVPEIGCIQRNHEALEIPPKENKITILDNYLLPL